ALGCTALQGMEQGKASEESLVPESKKVRLIKAIKRSDNHQVKQFLMKMKGEISAEEKKELVTIAHDTFKHCVDDTSLAKSPADRRSFLVYLGASLVTGALGYVVGKRFLKKTQVFVDRAALNREKDLSIAQDVFTQYGRSTNKIISPENLEKLVDEAVKAKIFSPTRLYWGSNYSHLWQFYENAYQNWQNNHENAYTQEIRKQEVPLVDCIWSLVGEVGLGLLFLKYGQGVLAAYRCPVACEKTTRAAEIKERVQLIEPYLGQ
nr:hypothetical protein [Candidatus Dependentiae bacterium]